MNCYSVQIGNGRLVRKFVISLSRHFVNLRDGGGFGEEIYLGSLSRHFVQLRDEGGLVRKFS